MTLLMPRAMTNPLNYARTVAYPCHRRMPVPYLWSIQGKALSGGLGGL
jgi:hypothetical protein